MEFMNLSGFAVQRAVQFHGVDPEQILVVHDEIDLPFARLRLKAGGGHGGHNGVRSVVEQLGTGDFLRVRIGVGRPERKAEPGETPPPATGRVSSHVLADFPAEMDADVDGAGPPGGRRGRGDPGSRHPRRDERLQRSERKAGRLTIPAAPCSCRCRRGLHTHEEREMAELQSLADAPGTLREYETIYILRPDTLNDKVAEVNQRVRTIIETMGGVVLNVDNWGKRKLAYEIKKELKGIYLFWQYLGPAKVVTEFERNMRMLDHGHPLHDRRGRARHRAEHQAVAGDRRDLPEGGQHRGRRGGAHAAPDRGGSGGRRRRGR